MTKYKYRLYHEPEKKYDWHVIRRKKSGFFNIFGGYWYFASGMSKERCIENYKNKLEEEKIAAIPKKLLDEWEL
jgi:hypothetical protein